MTLPNFTLRTVDSVQEAECFLSWLGERRPVLAVDTETTGLRWDDTTRLIQFGDGQGGWAVSVRNWRGVAAIALSALRDAETRIVLHHSQFDLHKLENDGLPIPEFCNVEDTLILSRLVSPHLPAGLKPVCARLFGREAVAGQDLLSHEMSKNGWTWATIPDDNPIYTGYGIVDTCLTALAYEHLRPLVSSEVYDREMAVLSVMYRAEKRGLRIDVDYTSALKEQWRQERDVLRQQLKDYGIDKPGSNPQVSAALKEAGWEPEEFTGTGAVKMDKSVVLALQSTPFARVAEPLLRYRRLTKWTSTYLDRFLSDRDANGRVHPNINTFGARTGRMTITQPGFNTLPSSESSIRNSILPYTDKERIVCVDYDNEEMRIFASYTGDPALIAAAKSEDFHRTTAALVFNKDEAEVTDRERSTAKGTNFGNTFGAGEGTMAMFAGVDVQSIRNYLSVFNTRFPGAQRFKDEVEARGKERIVNEGQGYITTSGGRRAVCEDDKVYSLVNYICQGSGADVLKQSVVALDSAGLGDFIMLTVHDEVVFSFPQDECAMLTEQAKECMEDYTTFSVPLTCSATAPLERWGHGKA